MMKKTLLLSALALGMLAPSANAITNTELADYLDGKICAQYFAGNHAEGGLGHGSCSGVFRKTGSNTVAVDYFYGQYTVDFTINSNNQLVLNCGANRTYSSTDGGSSKLNIYPTKLDGRSYTVNNREVLYCYIYSRNNNTSSTSSAYENITGNNANESGFSFTDYLALHPSDNTTDEWVFYTIKLFVIEPNGIQSDDDGSALVQYSFSDDNKELTIKNLWDFGVPYENTYKGVNGASANTVTLYMATKATIDEDGNFTIPAFKCGGMKYPQYFGYKGSGNSNSISASGRTWSGSTDVPNGYYFNPDNVTTSFNYISGGRNTTTAIKGKAYRKDFNHVGTGDNLWAYDKNINGSSIKTYKGEVVRLGEIHFIMGTSDVQNNSFILMTRSKDAEITHSVSLNIPRYGYGPLTSTSNEDYMYAEGKVTPTQGANADYVESYEIYAVPGTYSAVTDKAFNNNEKGHDEGVALNGYMIDWRAGKAASRSGEAESFKGGEFAVLVPAAELSSSLKDYTFYVKTNYTAESGLEPTFHALATPDRTTGIDDVLNLDNDEDAPAVYYNMNGVQVDGDNLTPGLYIRRQGNTATKVIIK